jgi:hypothetical protein
MTGPTIDHTLRGFGLVERNEHVWYPSSIDLVICREEDVEKQAKVPSAIENPNVTDHHAVFSILWREVQIWSWLPKRGASSLTQQVAIINIIWGIPRVHSERVRVL